VVIEELRNAGGNGSPTPVSLCLVLRRQAQGVTHFITSAFEEKRCPLAVDN
jgi:hypothetical protein